MVGRVRRAAKTREFHAMRRSLTALYAYCRLPHVYSSFLQLDPNILRSMIIETIMDRQWAALPFVLSPFYSRIEQRRVKTFMSANRCLVDASMRTVVVQLSP